MSTRDDPLTISLSNEQTRDRIFYREGILLDADDFGTEQLYHRGRLARTLAFLHGSGTVAGLEVRHAKAVAATEAGDVAHEEEIIVEAGMALDPFGRIIEVPRDACIRIDRWFREQDSSKLAEAIHATDSNQGVLTDGVVADVYLRFVACERGKTPALATGPFDATDAVAPSRLRDGYELKLLLVPDLKQKKLPSSIAPAPGTTETVTTENLQKAIFAAWKNQPKWPDLAGLVPGVDEGELIPLRLDPSAVFLARVAIPVAGTPPARKLEGTGPSAVPVKPEIDNLKRRFVHAAGALVLGLGL